LAGETRQGLLRDGQKRSDPPSRLRRYGAASFTRLAEPKLTLRRSSRERRMVDQNSASWNQIVVLLSQIDALRLAA
jgi:hypothetical protein